MQTIGKPVRRLAALGLLGATTLAVWQVAVAPALRIEADLGERLENGRIMLARLQRAAAQDGGSTANTAAEGAEVAKAFLAGESDAIALANLQSIVVGLATANGVRPQTTRTLPQIQRADLKLAGVRIEFSAPIEVVQKMLHTLETSRPLLFVEQLEIEASPVQPAGEERILRTAVSVYGAMTRRKG